MSRPSWLRITAALAAAFLSGAGSIWWLGTGTWSVVLAVLTAITACWQVLGYRRGLLR